MHSNIFSGFGKVVIMLCHINPTLTNQMPAPEQVTTPSATENTDLHYPQNVKSTLLNFGYYLAVLCLCWHLRNSEECEERYEKIRNLTVLKQRSDIFKCLNDIIQGNSRGKSLLVKMKGIRPIMLSASISLISDFKNEGKFIPHHFCAARNFDNFLFQVPIKETDADFRTFNVYDYEILKGLYQENNPYQGENRHFKVSNAITSLFTDVVLSCFMDCNPNLHITTSGSKTTFADLVDCSVLYKDRKIEPEIIEPCARSASFSFKHHKYFKKIHLNDADPRFYNLLWCMKNYPLHLISEIMIADRCNDLNVLRKAAKNEAIEREQAKDRGETLGKLPNGSSLVKIRNFMAARCNGFSDSIRDRVRAAAWLFLWVNMSFSGNFDSGISSKRLSLKNIYKILSEVLSAALVLQEAEISCMDCVEYIKQIPNDLKYFFFIDSPYVLHFGSACKTYSIKMHKDLGNDDRRKIIKELKPFGIDKIKELFLLAANARGKVLITHSAEHEVDCAAFCMDLDYLFSYTNKANGMRMAM